MVSPALTSAASLGSTRISPTSSGPPGCASLTPACGDGWSFGLPTGGGLGGKGWPSPEGACTGRAAGSGAAAAAALGSAGGTPRGAWRPASGGGGGGASLLHATTEL